MLERFLDLRLQLRLAARVDPRVKRSHRTWVPALVCVVAVWSSPLAAQRAPAESPLDHAAPLVVGHKLTMHSSVLGEDRQILIYLPGDYEASEQPLPVIYLLDGRALFNHTAATVDLLVVNGRMPRSMVVGITNIDRNRDFTSEVIEELPTGGADRFLDFIESELIPFVDENFRTAPHRTLIGHSLGGSLVVYTLVERSDLFQAAIAISPAISTNEMGESSLTVSQRLAAALEKRSVLPFSLFVTMAEGEGPRPEAGLDAILGVLRHGSPDTFAWEFRRMEGEDHGTTVLLSTYQGLRFINADWDTSGLVKNGTCADLVDRFDRLSTRLGFEVRPPEVMVNLMGYRLLGEDRSDEAIEVFEYNTRLYPESANGFDSLGEALEREGRLPGAMLNYRKAVQRAEADDDRLLPVFRANLERVETLLLERSSATGRVFESPTGERPDGAERR